MKTLLLKEKEWGKGDAGGADCPKTSGLRT